MIHREEIAQKCIFQTGALYPAPDNLSGGENRTSDYKSHFILQAFRGDDVMLKRLALSAIIGLPLSRLLKTIGLVKSNSLLPLPLVCI